MPLPVDERHLRAAEVALGRTLPELLRHRLLRANGGEARTADEDWSLFPVWDPTDRRSVRRTANHIVAETKTARKRSGFPPEAIALASNGGGDYLVALPGSDEILVWRHETREMERPKGLELEY